MGWMESLPLFCMAAKMVCDMIQEFVEAENTHSKHYAFQKISQR